MVDLSIDAIVSGVLSLLAIIISIVALIKSNNAAEKANEARLRANDIQMANLELNIRNMIENVKDKLVTINLDEMANIKPETLKTVKESYANVFDEACMKYLDGKVDRGRFKKTYFDELRNLVENDSFSDFYKEPQTKYKATVKVYNEWNDREK